MQQPQALTTVPRRVQAEVQSILIADCGSTWTKVALIGLVEGQYRLLACRSAPTTVAPPHHDLAHGILEATADIERITGRSLSDNTGLIHPQRPTGEGVDCVLVVSSAGEPLRVAVVGFSASNQVSTLLQAVAASYCTVGIFSLPPDGDKANTQTTQTIQEAAHFRPQALVLSGQLPAEASRLIATLLQQLRVSVTNETLPIPIVVPGAPANAEALRRMLGRQGEIHPLPPLIPGQPGPASLEFARLYERMVLMQLPGGQRVRSWTGRPLHATAQSLGGLVRFLAQHYQLNIVCVDIGGTTTTVISATSSGRFASVIRPGIGVAGGAETIIGQRACERLARWLPFVPAEDQLRLYARDKARYPEKLPATQRERHMEQAIAREAVLLALAGPGGAQTLLPAVDLIIGTGGCLAHASSFGEAALLLLDTMQPRGVCSLLLDTASFLPMLGELGLAYPTAAVQVTEYDGIVHRLGPCVVPWGTAHPGEIILRVQLDYPDGRRQSAEVPYGSVMVLPLGLEEHAALSLFPAPAIDVGLGRGVPARSGEDIDGGLVGLIIDARGRPLEFGADAHQQR
jgi:hypothetical protein